MGECCNSICKTYIIFLLSLYLCFMTSLGIICATWNGEIKNNFKTIHKRAYILEMRTVVHIQGCVQLCDPMDCSMPGLPVHHQLSKFIQTNVHWVSDAIQSSHSLSSPSPAAFNNLCMGNSLESCRLNMANGLRKYFTSSFSLTYSVVTLTM